MVLVVKMFRKLGIIKQFQQIIIMEKSFDLIFVDCEKPKKKWTNYNSGELSKHLLCFMLRMQWACVTINTQNPTWQVTDMSWEHLVYGDYLQTPSLENPDFFYKSIFYIPPIA